MLPSLFSPRFSNATSVADEPMRSSDSVVFSPRFSVPCGEERLSLATSRRSRPGSLSALACRLSWFPAEPEPEPQDAPDICEGIGRKLTGGSYIDDDHQFDPVKPNRRSVKAEDAPPTVVKEEEEQATAIRNGIRRRRTSWLPRHLAAAASAAATRLNQAFLSPRTEEARRLSVDVGFTLRHSEAGQGASKAHFAEVVRRRRSSWVPRHLNAVLSMSRKRKTCEESLALATVPSEQEEHPVQHAVKRLKRWVALRLWQGPVLTVNDPSAVGGHEGARPYQGRDPVEGDQAHGRVNVALPRSSEQLQMNN